MGTGRNLESMVLKAGRWIAILSFLIGTAFLIALFYNQDVIPFYAFFFIIGAAIINFIALILVIFYGFHSKKKAAFKKVRNLILLNIPIVAIYLVFAAMLMFTLRVKIINKTNVDLEHVVILACENYEIGTLKKHSKRTKWIKVKCDATLKVTYEMEGEIHTETILGYVTNGMGGPVEFEID